MNKNVLNKVKRIDWILADFYGEKKFTKGTDPLTELILTVLSQNTNDTNRDRAFESMKSRFPSWEDVMNARPGELAKAIKVGGLAKVKSGRIIRLLKSLKSENGNLNLGFIVKWDNDSVRDYLLKIDGVGPKTAACVLAFSLGRNVMPVDTHVHRVAGRLGILPKRMTAEAAHDYFTGFADHINLYQFHLNLITHGRRICKARVPLCGECPVKRLCNYYRDLSGKRNQAA